MAFTGSDGFEVGDSDLTNGDGGYWTGGYAASNGSLVGNDTTIVRSGTYSAKFATSQAAGSAFGYHSISAGADRYFQFWLNVNAITADNNTRTCILLRGRNTNADRILVRILYQTASTFKLQIVVFYDGGNATTTGTTVFNTGTWYCIEVRYLCAASNGGGQVWVNGTLEASDLTRDTDFANNQINRWVLGGETGFNFTAATIYYDDVKDHTAYIGLVSGLGSMGMGMTMKM